MTTSIRRTSTAEAIVHHLIERIRNGEYGPGDRLPSERLLQEELGVGRLSLREGLARLSALGIIRIDHGRGAFVEEKANSSSLAHAMLPSFSVRDHKAMEDLMQARELIEGEVAGLAAASRTDQDIAELEQILNTSDLQHLSVDQLADLDWAFHLKLAKVAQNQFFSVMLEAIHTHVHDFLVHYATAVNDPEKVVARHRPILQAIIEQDEEQAREQARSHVKVCNTSLQAYVDSQNQTRKR